MTHPDSFGARGTLAGGGRTYEIFRLAALSQRGLPVARLPFSLKILLENLLRLEDGKTVTVAHVGVVACQMQLPDGKTSQTL